MTESDPGGEIETVCSLLESEFRRRLLRCLESDPEPMPTETLVEQLRDGGPGGQSEQILVSLRHVHLPKLAAEDAIHYEAGVVALTDRGEKLLAYLDDLERRARETPVNPL